MPSSPKYIRLADTLRSQIESGQLKPGDQAPSEPALCERYGLSRGTVRQAIGLLVDQGLLRRDQGRGTFVRTPADRSLHFSLSSFADEMRRQQRVPGTRLLANEIVPAPPEIADRLAVQPGTPVHVIKRLRLADGEPVAVETRHLAQALCPELINEDLENGSIHWFLTHKYEIPLVRLEHVVELRPMGDDTTALLQMAGSDGSKSSEGMAFHVDRLTFTKTEAGEIMPAVLFQATYSERNYYIQMHTA